MNKKYERELTIATLFKAVFKHLFLFPSIFITIFIFGLIYSFATNTTIYYSETRLSNISVLGQSHYNSIRTILSTDEFLEKVVDKYTETTEKTITKDNIRSSIVFPVYSTSSQSMYYTIQFQNKDSNIVKPALSVYADVAVEEINASSIFAGYNFKVTEKATQVYTYKTDLNKNIMLFFVAGLGVAYVMTFSYHYLTDYVYDENDITRMGASVYTFLVHKKGDKKKTSLVPDFVSSLEYQKNPRIISITSPNECGFVDTVSSNVFKEYNKRGMTVAVVTVTNNDGNCRYKLCADSKNNVLEVISDFTPYSFNTFIADLLLKYNRVIITFPPVLKSQECLTLNLKNNVFLLVTQGRLTTNCDIYKSLLLFNEKETFNGLVLLMTQDKVLRIPQPKSKFDFDTIEI